MFKVNQIFQVFFLYLITCKKWIPFVVSHTDVKYTLKTWGLWWNDKLWPKIKFTWKWKYSSDCFTAEVPPSVNRWESTSNVQHGVYSSECHWWNTYTLRALVCLLLHPSLHPPHDSTCSLSFVFSTNMSVCQSPSVIRKWGEMFLHLSRKVGLHLPHTIQYLTSLLKKFISRIHVLHVNY